MTMEDDHFLPLLPRQFVQPLAQVNFLRNEQFPAEPADFPKRRRLAENKRSRRPFPHPADQVPEAGAAVAQEMALIHPHRATARQAPPRLDFPGHLRKKLPARLRIRVHKNQPLPARRRRARVARPGDLIDRLKDHPRPRRARQLRGRSVELLSQTTISIVQPISPERRARRLDAAQRRADQLLFIERRDDHRDFHDAKSCRDGQLKFPQGFHQYRRGIRQGGLFAGWQGHLQNPFHAISRDDAGNPQTHAAQAIFPFQHR